MHTRQYSATKSSLRQVSKIGFVTVHLVAEKLGSSVCTAIPAFNALTGCDSTSGLLQICKKKGWKVFVKYPSLHDSVGHLGSQIPPPALTVEACERFICPFIQPTR